MITRGYTKCIGFILIMSVLVIPSFAPPNCNGNKKPYQCNGICQADPCGTSAPGTTMIPATTQTVIPGTTQTVGPQPPICDPPDTVNCDHIQTADMCASPAAIGDRKFGLWHCGPDWCWWHGESEDVGSVYDYVSDPIWNAVDLQGDGDDDFNLIVFSFVHPGGFLSTGHVPLGMTEIPTSAAVNPIDYYRNRGIDVMLSIGGISFTESWNAILDDPTGCDAVALADLAAQTSLEYHVGIEIDWEGSVPPQVRLDSMNDFIYAYRDCSYKSECRPATASCQPTHNDNDAETWLTMDVGAGTRYLLDLSKLASPHIAAGRLSWINAMVANRPYKHDKPLNHWAEHLTHYNYFGAGDTETDPPDQVTGALYISHSQSQNCGSYGSSPLSFVMDCAQEWGMRGIMFWGGGWLGAPFTGEGCEAAARASECWLHDTNC